MVQGVLKTSIYEVKCFCEKGNGIEAGGWARQGCSALFLVTHFGLYCNDPFESGGCSYPGDVYKGNQAGDEREGPLSILSHRRLRKELHFLSCPPPMKAAPFFLHRCFFCSPPQSSEVLPASPGSYYLNGFQLWNCNHLNCHLPQKSVTFYKEMWQEHPRFWGYNKRQSIYYILNTNWLAAAARPGSSEQYFCPVGFLWKYTSYYSCIIAVLLLSQYFIVKPLRSTWKHLWYYFEILFLL